jgi:hypothetical protein
MTGNSEEEQLARAVLRLNGWILGLVLGIISGLLLFIATNWLVIKGGDQVGPHLSLLSQYFIGYSVTFIGSLIGAIYAFLCGFIVGWVIASVYNLIVWVKS